MQTLKLIREERELSQQELAQAIGMSATEICQIEKGKRNPHLSTRLKIENYFKSKLKWASLPNIRRTTILQSEIKQGSLRDIRIKQNITQSNLAKMAGTTSVTISLLENDHFKPSYRIQKRIEEALNIKINWD